MPKEKDDLPFEDESQDAVELTEDALRQAAPEDKNLRKTLFALRRQLERDQRELKEAREVTREYEEIYQKLTSPSNRIGVFLNWTDEKLAIIAVGDSEFLASVDPKIDPDALKTGDRVKVNEAYAVIGSLGPHPGGAVVKVTEALEDGRLRVASDPTGAAGRLAFRSGALEAVKIEPGDEVRIEPNGRVAVEHIPRQGARDYYFEEIPALTWDQVGGQDEAIQLIKDTIELPMFHADLYKKFDMQPVRGILLYGPPGCGKTLIGKATAYNLTQQYRERTGQDVKEYFMYINGPKILNMWLGETERMVREIFSIARDRAKEGFLVFIFIDEAESILRTRSSGRWLNISNTVVPQFCAEMDGLVSLENTVVMLTSNRPDYIDPAILRPGRIDRKVKIKRPDKAAARDIFGIYLTPALPLEKGAGREELLDVATDFLWRKSAETEFVQVYLRNGGIETLHWKDLASGALIKSVVDRAKELAIHRAIDDPQGEHGLSADDLREAVRLEYRENEIFPKSDVMEDWLKLLDYEPEAVASVRPIRPSATPKARNIV